MNKSTLKELTYKIGSGATPSGGQKSYHNDGVSLIRSQNVHDFRFSTNGLAFICEEQATSLINVEVKVNDILLNITGDSIARACMVSNNVLPARVNQHVAIIRANDKIDCNYLLCYLVNLKPYLLKICGVGGTRNALTKEAIEKLEIQYPSKKSQERIGGIIQNINSKIELNNRINAELESMAKTIYDYWFVQFDFPDKNGKPYKTSGGKMVWNEELKREVPEGWEVKELENCIEKIIDHRGKTPKKLGGDWSENQDDIIALSAKHVKGGKLVNLKVANRVNNDLYDLWMKEPLRNGDILMTSEAPCGEFFYLVGKTQYCLSQRLFAIRANSMVVEHAYLYFELSIGNGFSQIQGKMSGSTVFGIRQDELRTVKVLRPEKSIQLLFAELLEGIYLQIRNNEYQNIELTELRDWLLPMLMNGQVRVSD
jgi:type I restriction enzyme S subunit